MSSMFQWPFSFESKAICFPSGDQTGVPPPDTTLTSRAGSVPSALLVHIASVPSRFETYATRFPSGEYLGCISIRDEAISLLGEPLSLSETFQIFESKNVVT